MTQLNCCLPETHAGGRARAAELNASECRCLIVSAAEPRRVMLARAASKAGCESLACHTPRQAQSALERIRFPVVWIDLDESGDAYTQFRDLCETLSSVSPRMLLAICGKPDKPEEEIWGRQLGVWMYLPGVSTGQIHQVSRLCEQARRVVAKHDEATTENDEHPRISNASAAAH